MIVDCKNQAELDAAVAAGHTARVRGGYYVARGSASVEARESASVVARGFASVVALGSASVVARSAFAVTIRRSRNTVVRGGRTVDAFEQPTDPRKWAAMVGLDVKRGRVTLYKRVGDNFATRPPRGATAAITYTPGTEVEAPDWDLCPTPAQCDAFRDSGLYIACSVALADLAIHAEPSMPDKVKARRVKVLYVCDREGNEVK